MNFRENQEKISPIKHEYAAVSNTFVDYHMTSAILQLQNMKSGVEL